MIISKILHKIFGSEFRRKSITEITVEELRALGVTTVAIDADNTITHDLTIDPLPGAPEWIQKVKDAGFKVIVVSNGTAKRVGVLAANHGIDSIGFACKPTPLGFIRMVIRTRTAPGKICMIGDQLFTDIIGANILGFKTIYVYPFEKEQRSELSFAARRLAEKHIFAYQDRKYGVN